MTTASHPNPADHCRAIGVQATERLTNGSTSVEVVYIGKDSIGVIAPSGELCAWNADRNITHWVKDVPKPVVTIESNGPGKEDHSVLVNGDEAFAAVAITHSGSRFRLDARRRITRAMAEAGKSAIEGDAGKGEAAVERPKNAHEQFRDKYNCH